MFPSVDEDAITQAPYDVCYAHAFSQSQTAILKGLSGRRHTTPGSEENAATQLIDVCTTLAHSHSQKAIFTR